MNEILIGELIEFFSLLPFSRRGPFDYIVSHRMTSHQIQHALSIEAVCLTRKE